MPRYLVVAHQTADSEELGQAVLELAGQEPDAEFVLLVPATPIHHLGTWTEGESHAVAERQAASARHKFEEAGVRIAGAGAGDASPFQAVADAVLGEEYDGIVVSTLPPGISRWLKIDLIHRLERSYDLPITHVVAYSKGS